uniref:Uncharacterized protein n=1 Tax=Poecilia formosa TaxID=48698 RepID=A0A096ME33_POEFO
MTAEAILRLVSDPVLPFYPLDIVLDVQNKLKDKNAVSPPLLSSASTLRDHAAFFQSEAMRPANDPKERDPSHVRMLNDVLRDLEKSFIMPQTPAGVFRYTLIENMTRDPLFAFSKLATVNSDKSNIKQTLSYISSELQMNNPNQESTKYSCMKVFQSKENVDTSA